MTRDKLEKKFIKQNAFINRLYDRLAKAKDPNSETKIIYKIYDACAKYDKLECELATAIFNCEQK